MKKILLVLLFALPFGILQSQIHSYLEVNNIKAKINTNGTLFTPDPDMWISHIPTLEVPKGSGINSITTTAFWMGGLDENQTIHLAQNMLGEPNVSNYSNGQ